VLQEEKQAKVLLAFQFCQTKGRTGKEKEPEKELFWSFLTADKQTNSCHLFDSCHALIGLIFRVMAKRKTLGCQIDSPKKKGVAGCDSCTTGVLQSWTQQINFLPESRLISSPTRN
jgi:hypothetical protein